MLNWLKRQCNVKEEGAWLIVPGDIFCFVPDLKEGAIFLHQLYFLDLADVHIRRDSLVRSTIE